MKQTPKIIIISVLIGFIAFPTITLGGTFVSSLIQGKTVEEAIQILAEQLDILIGRVEVIETKQVEQEGIVSELQSIVDQQKGVVEEQKIQLTKESACRKADELKIAPPETKIAYYTEANKTPIYHKRSPDTTKELLEYLHNYIKNYEETGSPYYTGIPDYTPELAQKYIPILEERWQEYLVQQELCNQ